MALLGFTVVGCGTGPVSVEDPAPDGDVAPVCAALVESLPSSVDGAGRREVEPAGVTAAAWGDPAIVLRCGVRRPDGLDEFATCQETDGVGWYVPEEQMTGAPRPLTITTVDREVYVEVFLPEEHWPPANAMVDLATAIKKTIPQSSPCI